MVDGRLLREQRFDLVVADLTKVAIELSDREELRGRFEAHNRVGLVLERLESFRGRDRRREDEALRMLPANSAQSGPRRRSGRDTIVDDDHSSAL